MTRRRVLSGIQPTGDLHIGNLLGALRNWARMIADHECFFCIVDYHAMTVAYDPRTLPRRIFDAAVVNMAAGIDPSRSVLFVQSAVPEHTELAWILGTVTPMGALERMTQFKEKAEQHRENINAGLFTYPVLQAADIAIYRAELVPVGDDQVQHLELAREIVRKFNARYGEILPEPQPVLSAAARVKGLDGDAKMSKSRGNGIGILEDEASIRKRLAVAVTDPARKRRSDPGNPDVCNIFSLHRHFSPPEVVTTVDRDCRTAAVGCVDCKRWLADHLIADLLPIQERARSIAADPARVHDVLETGAQRARAVACETMDAVRRATGLGSSVRSPEGFTGSV